MLNLTEDLKKEHEMIEQELVEFELSFSSEIINYSNLIHTFRKITAIWDDHEKKEEDFFRALKRKNYGIPYEQIIFEHGSLCRFKNLITRAINSGNNAKIKEALDTKGLKMVEMLRRHMEAENEILFRLPEDIDFD